MRKVYLSPEWTGVNEASVALKAGQRLGTLPLAVVPFPPESRNAFYSIDSNSPRVCAWIVWTRFGVGRGFGGII